MVYGHSVVSCFGHKNAQKIIVAMDKTRNEIGRRISEFIENEMRSCSMDIGGITPEYVQRAWGGRVAIEDIETAYEELKRSDDLLRIEK